MPALLAVIISSGTLFQSSTFRTVKNVFSHLTAFAASQSYSYQRPAVLSPARHILTSLLYSLRPAVFSPACRILTGPPYSYRPAVFLPARRILTGPPYSYRPAVFSSAFLKERERGQGSRSRRCSLGLKEFIQVHTDAIDTGSQSGNPPKEQRVLRTLLKIKKEICVDRKKEKGNSFSRRTRTFL